MKSPREEYYVTQIPKETKKPDIIYVHRNHHNYYEWEWVFKPTILEEFRI